MNTKLKDCHSIFCGLDTNKFLLIPAIHLGFYRDSFVYYFGFCISFLIFTFRVSVALAFNWKEIERFNKS
jgi:hypothetical protein